MNDEQHDELAVTLRELSERFGPDAFLDRRRIISLVSDRIPSARRAARVLALAIDAGAFEALARASAKQVTLELDRLAAQLDDKFGIRKEVVLPVLRAVAYALKRGELPSTYEVLPRANLAPKHEPNPTDNNEGFEGLSSESLSQRVRLLNDAGSNNGESDDTWIGLSNPVVGAPVQTGTERHSLVSDTASMGKAPPPPSPSTNTRKSSLDGLQGSNLVGIRGWLLLLAIVQIFACVGVAFVILGSFKDYERIWKIHHGPEAIWGELVLNVALLGLTVFTTYRLFCKSRSFTDWYIAQTLFAILVPIVDWLWVFALLEDAGSISTLIGQAIGSAIRGGLWLLYLRTSRRVANTMVN